MKVAVIGGTGRIGSKITAELLQRGHTVTVIARNPEKAESMATSLPRVSASLIATIASRIEEQRP